MSGDGASATILAPWRIGIDAHVIGARKTGNERVISNLIEAMQALSHDTLVLYFSEAAAAHRYRHERSVIRRIPRHALARIGFALPAAARRDRLDVLLVQYTAPPVIGCPIVTLVHDVAFARHPEFFSATERVWMTRTIPWTMQRAAHVVTVSEFSRDEIVSVYSVPKSRITVAHNGVDPVFWRRHASSSIVSEPYFVALGNLQPRKNLATLLRAYERLAREGSVRERLVIVGQPWLKSERTRAQARPLVESGHVVFTGYRSDAEVAALLAHATALAFPSVYEGFGLPVVEAMAAGAPVILSDIPVLREIAGDAAVFVPPSDVGAWARALARLSSDAAERDRLRARGRITAAEYTWDRSAATILKVLRDAAASGRHSR